MKIINGHIIANKILKSIKLRAISYKLKANLGVILIGKNPASHLYVSLKEQKAKEIGINFKKYLLPEKTKPAKVIQLIQQLNQDRNITAILIQLPLPKHFKADKIISTILPNKDADGIHPAHLKLLKQGQQPPVLPATTGAILEILKSTKLNLKNKSITFLPGIRPYRKDLNIPSCPQSRGRGMRCSGKMLDKSVAIIGKSKIVGLPTYYYLKNKVKKINIYDSKTKNLAQKTNQADILIVAIGSPKFITAEYIKPDAVVIDVGINKIKDKTVGDVDFDSVKNKVKYITPVPGGVGPITVAVLLKNTLTLSKAIQ